MKSKHSEERVPHVTRGSVLDDLGFSPSEALELKVKAEIYGELLDYIDERGYSQQELSDLLGILQPEVSNLLTGKVSKFSPVSYTHLDVYKRQLLAHDPDIKLS